MRTVFRTTESFVERVKGDLRRPHAFAFERVGFISVKAARGSSGLVLIAHDYHPVADEDYIDDPTVGALMGQDAIRKALNVALFKPLGMFHVHVHEHPGRTRFSRVDLREQLKFVPPFFSVRADMPHGAIVIGTENMVGRCWLGRDRIVDVAEFQTVGHRNVVQAGGQDGSRLDVVV